MRDAPRESYERQVLDAIYASQARSFTFENGFVVALALQSEVFELGAFMALGRGQTSETHPWCMLEVCCLPDVTDADTYRESAMCVGLFKTPQEAAGMVFAAAASTAAAAGARNVGAYLGPWGTWRGLASPDRRYLAVAASVASGVRASVHQSSERIGDVF